MVHRDGRGVGVGVGSPLGVASTYFSSLKVSEPSLRRNRPFRWTHGPKLKYAETAITSGEVVIQILLVLSLHSQNYVLQQSNRRVIVIIVFGEESAGWNSIIETTFGESFRVI